MGNGVNCVSGWSLSRSECRIVATIVLSMYFQSRFCSLLALPTAIQKAATYIAKKAQDMDLVPGYVPYVSVRLQSLNEQR